MFPAHVFREYDIRGLAERDLSSELIRRVGLCLAEMLRPTVSEDRKLRIAVARDCRLSSPRIYDALVDGLLRQGVHVIDVGIGPSPMLYFAVHHLGTDGGVMITGSHNPGDENGLKIMRGKGSFFGDDIRNLRDRVKAGVDIPNEATGSIEAIDVRPAYLKRLTEGIDLSSSGLRVVIDAGNGAAGPLGLAALRGIGLDPEALHCEMDGTFPNHHPDPTMPENLAELIAKVRETKASLGLAWDGDGDRLGAVDENGNIVWGDKLMILFSRDVLKKNPGAAILGEVKCSQTLYDDIEKNGGRPILWKTGHSLIKTKMKEENALLAGEMSGHIFFADRYLGFDDGIYAAIRLCEIVAQSQKTIGELLADVPETFVTEEIRVPCPDGIKFEVVAKVRDHYRDKYPVIEVDGARILFGDGAWGLVRASNTGPILVLRFEAKSEARRDELRREVEGVVASEREALGG